MMRRKEAQQAMALWGLEAKRIRRVRSVFKVVTDQGVYCLKPVKDKEARLRFFDSVLRYVADKGFPILAPYIRTQAGELVGVHAEQRLILCPWIRDTKEINYRNIEEVTKAATVLGQFHYAAQGYLPEEGIQIKDKQGKWVEKLARRTQDVQYFIEMAKKSNRKYDHYFLEHAGWILNETSEAFFTMRESDYYGKVDESMYLNQLCHGDPSKRNFIKNSQGEVFLIDFDSMKSDLPVVDLWRFLRRILSRDQWKMEMIKPIIDGYTSQFPLDRRDFEILYSFLLFPEKIWRNAHKYYERQGWDSWSHDRLLRNFKRLVSQKEDRNRFLTEFKEIFLADQPIYI